MRLQHRNSVLIREQKSLVNVKTILRKYDCKNYSTTGRSADRLLVLLMRKGGDEGLKDAMEISSVVGGKTEQEPEKLYLQHLLEDKHDPLAALSRLQYQLATSIDAGVAMVDTAKMIIKLEVGEAIEQSYMVVVKGVLALLTNTKRKEQDCSDIIEKAETLLRANCLKTEFGLITEETSLQGGGDSIMDPTACKKLLYKFLEKEVLAFDEEQEDTTDNKVKSNYNRLKRICDLLRLEIDEAMAGLVLRLEDLGMMKSALMEADIIKADNVNADMAESFYSVLYRMSAMSAEAGGSMVGVTGNMMRQSLTYCNDASLVDCLELSTWQDLESRVHGESNERRVFTSGGGDTLYDEWRFSHVYTDKGLALDVSELLPLSRGCMTSVLPLVETQPLPFLPRSRAANVEIQDLDVTAPDLEAAGNGVDVVDSCNALASAGHSLVGAMQMAGHCMLGLQCLQATSDPMSALLLATDPEMQTRAEAGMSQARSSLVTQLVKRVVADPRANMQLGLGLVTAEHKKNSQTLLAQINASLGGDYRKISSLAMLGAELCGLHGLVKQQDQFRACWGRKLSEMDISFKAAFEGSKSDIMDMLKTMVTHPKVSGGLDDSMADFTINLNSIKNVTSSDNVDETNLLRCVYMLQAGDSGIQYLLKFSLSREHSVSTNHKPRALKCLFSICS